MRLVIAAVVCLGLTGCGSAYISPSVPDDDPNVAVIDISPATIGKANSSSYVPRALPAVFFQTAGGPGAGRGAGAVPEPTLEQPVRPQSLPLRVPPSAEQFAYQIGVGDIIILATSAASNSVEALSGLLAAQNRRQGYTVQDDGTIAIPDVGRIEVAGLTIEDAESQVFQTLVENQIDPNFSIEISGFNSQRVSIGGAVRNPAVVPIGLTQPTLEEVLAASGGVAAPDLEFASIRLYRDGELYQIPLTDYLERPSLQKTRLANGDSVFVDTAFELDKAQQYFQQQITLAQFKQTARIQALNELNAEVALRQANLREQRSNFEARVALDAVDRDFVYLTGEVSKPSRFPLPFEYKASLADALFGESGVSTRTANPSEIYVLRGRGGHSAMVDAWRLNVENAANMVLATKFELRPDDIVFVAEQPVTRWDRVISQISPSLITAGAGAVSN